MFIKMLVFCNDGSDDATDSSNHATVSFIVSNREISNQASQILKANMLLICPYCLKFQIARDIVRPVDVIQYIQY